MSKFCAECGTELSEGARFCVNCGVKIEDVAFKKINEPDKNISRAMERTATNELQMNRETKEFLRNEELLGIFPGVLEIGKLLKQKMWQCNLYFTTNRLIAAYEKRYPKLYRPRYNSFMATARDKLKMKEISLENLLKENEENFEVPYSEIEAIEMKPLRLRPYRNLLIFFAEDLNTPKYTFGLAMSHNYDNVFDDFLQKILPDKI